MIELEAIRRKRLRRVVGLISGTSADGVDAAIVEIEEKNGFSGAKLVCALTMAYPNGLKRAIQATERYDVGAVCDLNYAVGESFAEAALKVLREARIDPSACDLIGSHGQTVCHRPRGESRSSTLQIGEAAVIVERTGVVTVSDFRSADIAAGGEGAPLVPLADFFLFRPERGVRLLLNIGGIANITLLAPDREGVGGFDTGPGNALIDSAVRSLTPGKLGFDQDGGIAAQGRPDEKMLTELMAHPYLRRRPPKSTGLDMFGATYVEELRGRYPDLPVEDFIATLTHFTARTIIRAVEDYVGASREMDKWIYVGGGGSHNRYLMEILSDGLRPHRITSIDKLGMPTEYREAVAFAVLANETIEGRPGNLPSVTGAKRGVVLGKISVPTRR